MNTCLPKGYLKDTQAMKNEMTWSDETNAMSLMKEHVINETQKKTVEKRMKGSE